MSSPSTVSQSDLKKLQKRLDKVKAAVNAGNFVVARKEFSKVEATWETVKVPVRAKSIDGSAAVEIYMDEVQHTLYNKPLSREKATLSLHSLEKSIESATTS